MQQPGVYLASFSATLYVPGAVGATYAPAVEMRINGGESGPYRRNITIGQGGYAVFSATFLVPLQQGDELTLWLRNPQGDSNPTLTTVQVIANQAELTVVKVG